MATLIAVRILVVFTILGAISGEQDSNLDNSVAPSSDDSFTRGEVRSWSPYKVREVVGQLAETVEDLGKKLLEMPIDGPSGAPGPPGPRGFPV